jgi:hypothetical protein
MNSQGVTRKRRGVLVVLGFAIAVTLAVGAPSASAALFPQCPPVGANDGCSILITIDSSGQGSVQADPNPPNNAPYDGSDDTLVGLQNNAPGNVTSVNLSSATQPIFGFDDDGICDPSSWPGPPGNGAAPGCPSTSGFGPTDYEGPNNTFDNISADTTSGRVLFTNPIPPGGSAYWALEERLSAADVNVGSVAGASCGSVTASATGYKPRRSLTPTVPGVRAWVYVDTPSQLLIDASLNVGGKASASRSVSLGTFAQHNPGKKKLRIAIPKKLHSSLPLGTKVDLVLEIKTTPDSAPACASKNAQKLTVHTKVVHILKNH